MFYHYAKRGVSFSDMSQNPRVDPLTRSRHFSDSLDLEKESFLNNINFVLIKKCLFLVRIDQATAAAKFTDDIAKKSNSAEL